MAVSLTNLAGRLSELGRHDAALDMAQDAVEIRRDLAAAQPDAFCVALSTSLGAKTMVLIGLERKAEALATTAEAIAILRPYFLGSPAPFAGLMSGHVRNYQKLSQQLESEPDTELLGPITQMLEHMDSADDNVA